jgi:hypothetical protein
MGDNRPSREVFMSPVQPICAISSFWMCLECACVLLTFPVSSSIEERVGPTKERYGIWRIKTNDELDQLIRHKNVINYIKAQRLSWFGHLH